MCRVYRERPQSEAFHGKCDSFERDIIIGRFRSFSTIVIFGVSFDSSYLPKDYYSHANILYIIALRRLNFSYEHIWPIIQVCDVFAI